MDTSIRLCWALCPLLKDGLILRELGKVFGLPKDEIDKMIKDPDNELFKNNKNKKIREYALKLEGFPNLRSIHAGGILISHKPIFYYSALDLPPKGFSNGSVGYVCGRRYRFRKAGYPESARNWTFK
jgi:hypothetical protein